MPPAPAPSLPVLSVRLLPEDEAALSLLQASYGDFPPSRTVLVRAALQAFWEARRGALEGQAGKVGKGGKGGPAPGRSGGKKRHV